MKARGGGKGEEEEEEGMNKTRKWGHHLTATRWGMASSLRRRPTTNRRNIAMWSYGLLASSVPWPSMVSQPPMALGARQARSPRLSEATPQRSETSRKDPPVVRTVSDVSLQPFWLMAAPPRICGGPRRGNAVLALAAMISEPSEEPEPAARNPAQQEHGAGADETGADEERRACANPECEYCAHSAPFQNNIEYGYCCNKCYGRHIQAPWVGRHSGGRSRAHYKNCERIPSGAQVSRAAENPAGRARKKRRKRREPSSNSTCPPGWRYGPPSEEDKAFTAIFPEPPTQPTQAEIVAARDEREAVRARAPTDSPPAEHGDLVKANSVCAQLALKDRPADGLRNPRPRPAGGQRGSSDSGARAASAHAHRRRQRRKYRTSSSSNGGEGAATPWRAPSRDSGCG